MIIFRRLRWTEHVARLEEDRGSFKMMTGKPSGKMLVGNLGVDGRKIIE